MSLTLYINNKPGKSKVISKNGSCVTLYLDPVLKLDQEKQYFFTIVIWLYCLLSAEHYSR